jgi:hypothetical protein
MATFAKKVLNQYPSAAEASEDLNEKVCHEAARPCLLLTNADLGAIVALSNRVVRLVGRDDFFSRGSLRA